MATDDMSSSGHNPRRREFLRALAALATLGPLPLLANAGAQRLMSCRTVRAATGRRHLASLFSSDGQALWDVSLPARGHGIALSHDGRHAVICARRPGDFLVVIDLAARQVLGKVGAAAGRHYYGHAVFSADDQILYATENAYQSGDGRIGIYDAGAGFTRVGELPSHGIGPHELCLHPDGETLVVANGGIRTHPDRPRAKLNLDSMRSTLTYLDRHDGRLLHAFGPPPEWPRLGIRHIAVAADGQVAMALQFEGARDRRPPLVGVQRGDDAAHWLTAPDRVQTQMRNYCGSVAFAADGASFAVSSPRGGLVTRWSRDGDYLGAFSQTDVCGLAADRRALWASDGHGGLSAWQGERRMDERTFDDSAWDNHLVIVGA